MAVAVAEGEVAIRAAGIRERCARVLRLVRVSWSWERDARLTLKTRWEREARLAQAARVVGATSGTRVACRMAAVARLAVLVAGWAR